MCYYTEQFQLIFFTHGFSIVSHPIQTKVELTHDQLVRCAVIEGDDIGIVIVLKELLVDFEQFVIRHENNVQFLYRTPILASQSIQPGRNALIRDEIRLFTSWK